MRLHFTSAALCLAILAGCSPKPVAPNVLAKVGARDITTEDFEREVQWLVRNRRPLPDKEVLLEQLIRRELRLQKAKAAGLEHDPDVRRRYEAILAGKVEDLELQPRMAALTVTPEEVRTVYEKEIERYTRPAKVRLALVCIKTDRKMSAEKLTEAEARINEARKLAVALPAGTRGLGAAAADFSDDQASRYRGGDVGWFDQGRTDYRWPAEVVSAGFALARNGEVSEVIKASDGFYFVSRMDSREGAVTPLAQVQSPIQRRLLVEKRQEAEAAFNEQLRLSAPVQMYPQALADAPYPATTSPKAEDLPPQLPGTTIAPQTTSSAHPPDGGPIAASR